MPRYRFQWANLPAAVLADLCDALVEGEGDPAELLKEVYGARPKEEFLREAWPVLLESWLARYREPRHAVVSALRAARGEEGAITNRRAQLEYLRGLRNAKALRSIVLDEFIKFGEANREALTSRPAPPADRSKSVAEPACLDDTPKPPPTSGGHVTITEQRTPTPASAPFTAAPGSVVLVRDAEWLVTAVEQATDGYFVHVVGLSELVRDTEATFSTAIDDIVTVDPAKVRVVADDSPGFRRSRLWLEASLRKTPVAISDPRLTVAHRALADPLEYQLAAVRKALDPDKLRPRVLLADAVGLGKTIEIGMILSELVRRGRGERILIVTPKHVLEQMQMELWTRFALPFVRLDSAGIQRIRQILPANRNPFTYYKRVIISIDTLKSDRYINHLRKQWWDAVVIDESHNVTNNEAQKGRLARLLAERTDALILASATPHNGKAESFAELVRMLDPSAVGPNNELDLDQVAKLVIRRHRHHPEVAAEVGAEWAERQPPNNIIVDASPSESAIARELETVWLWPESGSSPYSGANAALFPWVLAKAFLSSPVALLESIDQRISRLDEHQPDQKRELVALQRLRELATACLDLGPKGSAKFTALVDHLRRIGVARSSDRRAVVFAERVATLNWLAEHVTAELKLAKDQVVILHGGLSDTEQQEIVESFKLESSPIRVLITGDVASEGVNLHSQCHHLVHYDIPWSLIRIEQRNGRIDRYGQRHRPQITTLLLNPDTERFAGDIRVLTRLVEREHEAHTALGDAASLIGTYDVKAEEDAIREVLAGQKTLDEVVHSVEEVTNSGGLDAFFAQLSTGAIGQAPPASEPTNTGGAPSAEGVAGVYDTDFAFLADAIEEFWPTPQKPPPNGIKWEVEHRYSIASLIPPADLRQRLQVLPQSYLRDRKVAENFKLAITPTRGNQELRQAKSGASRSTWPEAHFLAPLHPILEWATDRALSELSRDEIFAVRGNLAHPTVLVLVSQSNQRGQVIAGSYYTVEFPDPASPALALANPQPNAQHAIDALQLLDVNTGPVAGVEALQPLVAAAVTATDAAAEQHAEAIRAETARRIDEWLQRTNRWKQAAQQLRQHRTLRRHAQLVDDEQALAKDMNPDRRLVRPLLVVVPADFDGDSQGAR